MIQIIDDPKAIKNFQKEFTHNLIRHLNMTFNSYVGFHGGTVEAKLHYSPDLDIWLTTDENLDNRYWNGFGIGKPENGSLESLSAEINISKYGINRRIGGAFGKSDSGNILILHRGKIGGGRAGIGKTLFENNYRGKFIPVIDGDRINKIALVGELKAENLALQVANFVKEVNRIKKENKSLNSSKLIPVKSKENFNNEYAGTKEYSMHEVIRSLCNHGIVVNTLARTLEGKGYKIANDKHRDLYILTESGKIDTIFEIKTNTLTGSLYSAIGQLILYSIGLEKNTKLFLVLPDQLKPEIEKRVKSIGIDILYYKWEGVLPTFKNLDKKL